MATKHQTLYCIAGLLLELSVPMALECRNILRAFEPFRVDDNPVDQKICTIEISFEALSIDAAFGKLLSDVSVVWGEHFRFYEQEDCYLTVIGTEKQEDFFIMKSNKDFSQSVIYSCKEASKACNVLSWLIMVAFGQACLLHQAILIHASVVACKGKGFAFLGKSGTGKSTHSRLWLAHVEAAELLNDDNPAIRIENDGQVYVYGTPWSGKTACYKNMKVPLQGFVRLKQAPSNQLSYKKGMEALVCILPSCTAIRWNMRLFTLMTDTVEALVQKVCVAELACLPNEEAASLCYQKIYNN